jgi:hypothetical protein
MAKNGGTIAAASSCKQLAVADDRRGVFAARERQAHRQAGGPDGSDDRDGGDHIQFDAGHVCGKFTAAERTGEQMRLLWPGWMLRSSAVLFVRDHARNPSAHKVMRP